MIYTGGADELETFVMTNCLMLTQAATLGASSDMENRMFTCKTCGKKFNSFQALGGHRASHKKPKAIAGGNDDLVNLVPTKPKSHACSICMAEFPTGQALGGHMRRHRPGASHGFSHVSSVTTDVSDGNNQEVENDVKKRKNDDVTCGEIGNVLKKSNSSKRVCLDFNLSFAPWMVENEEDKDGKTTIEEGEIVEHEEDDDFLKLELRQPIRV